MEKGPVWILLLSVFIPLCVYTQNTHDTLFVNGPTPNSHQYITYYIDSSSQKEIAEIAHAKTNFIPWGERLNLNVGLNPYPLWLHLNVTSNAEDKIEYWLSFYTQADSVFVYEHIAEQFVCIDTLTSDIAQSERKIRTRFLATAVEIGAGESREFYIKIISRTRTQNFITDFTTPEANLLWERNFSWLVLFFTGCFTLAAFISLVAAFALREKTFLFYSIYILSIILLLLSQELMLPILSPGWFALFNAIHPMAIAIIGLTIHYRVILYITGRYRSPQRIISIFKRINAYCLWYGIAGLTGYFIFRESALSQLPFYHFLYDLSVCIIFLLLFMTFLTIVLSATTIKGKIAGFVIASLLLYFNPAGYYLNYSGIVRYYEITYPNYFYWVLCFELIILGYVISLRFRQTDREKDQLIKEKESEEQQRYLRELEIQEREKKQIARDLHDDLGATLSAIKLIVTNNYNSDTHLVQMITRANTDLRYFFSKLSSSETIKEKRLFKILEEKKQEINRSGTIRFSFIAVGDDNDIPQKLRLPIYWIVNELLTNILKHSQADEASFQLIVDEGQAQLITEDNGIGYDNATKSAGMGINNIHIRVQGLNGAVHVSSNEHGTTTIVIIPLQTRGKNGRKT